MGGGGGYLLLVLNPPWTPEHKEAILQRVAKGLLSWDVKATGTDLASAEKACLSVKVSAGPHNELLIQHSTESLALEVLLNPEVSTLRQCFKNMMVSGTTHKHVIHAGYAFAGSGDWILQDGVFSARDVEALLHDADVQEVLRRQKFHTLHVHCSAEGSWAQPPVGVSLNPPDIADSLAGSVHLLGCLDAVLTSPPLTSLLPSSSVVGNIRFRRPTMYVFPGGQGDCALFGVTGFTLLVDGGFARKPCFWEFVRHLDRLDSLLVTRFNQFNSCGLTALAQRKALERVYPQVGHVFCNAVRSPSDEELQKDRDQLVVSVVAQGLEFLQGVREMGLSPQACQRDARPLTLYHKVGHGTLEMFVLSPGRSTEEDASVCALLVWRPAKVSEPVTRILLPGSASQNVIFEGLSKLGHLAVLKSRAVTAEARLGLKKSKVQDKPLRATSVPPRPSVAKRAAAKVESPSPSPTPPPAEKVRAPVKQTNKSIESLPKKQDEVKKPSKTGAKREPKKSAVEKADAKDEKAPKITAKVPAKVAETIPAKEKIVEKLGENELDNVEEKDISKIISDKPLKKLPLEIEKIDTKAQEEIVAKVEEKVAAKRELKKATPTRPPAKSKGAKDVTNKMAVESKTTARKTADPAKVKPRPLVAPPTRPMVRDSKSKSPSSSASSSPKRTPPKPTTERPVRSVRGGVRNAKAPAAEPVKLPEGEKPVLIEKPTAQVKPDKRIEVLTQSGDESSGSKEAIEEKAATEATKEDKPFIEPSSSDESKKDIPKQKSPVTVDEAPIKAVLLGTAHAMPTTDFQAVPTKPLEKDIADAETWPAEGDAKEVAETPEHALSPEPTVSASSEGVPSLIDEVIDVSLKADSSVARQITEPELSRVRALSSGQRTPDSLDTPHEVGDGTAPSSRDEILEAMEKHQLVSREQVLEIKRRDSVDSIEGEIPMEDEEIVHPPQEADKKTAGVPISAHVGQEFPEPDDHAELKQKFQQPTQRAADLPSHDIEHATDEPSKRSPEEPCAEPAMVEKPEGVVLDTAKEEPSAVGMLDTADEKICDAEIIAKAESQIETSAPEISVSAAKDIAQKEPPEFKGTTEAEPMTKQLKEDSVLSTVRETSDNKPSEPSGIEPEKPTDDTKQADLHEITEKPSEPSVIEMVEQVIESPAQKTPESKVSEDAEEKPAKPDATDKIKLEFERTKQEILASEVPEVLKTKPAGPESIQKLEPAIQKPTEETTKAAVFEVAEKLLGESEIMQKVEQDIERLADESRVSSVPEVREKSAEPDGIEKTEPKFERQAEKTPVSAVPEFAEKKPAKPEGVQKAEPGIDIPDEETTISAVPDVAAKKPAEPEGVQQMEPEIERPAEGSPLRAVPDVAEKLAEPDSVEKVEPDIGVTGQDTFASVVPVFLEKQPAEPEVIQMVEPGIEKLAEDTPLSAVPDVTEKKAVESEGFQKGEPAIQRPTEETPARSVAEAVEKPTEPESIEKMKPEIKSPAEEAPVSTVPEATEKKPAEPESFIKVEPEPERPSDDTSGATVHEVEEKKPAEPESIDQEKQEIERPPQETPLSGEPELAEKAAESEGDVKVEPEIGRLAEEPSMSAMPEVAEDKPTEPEGADKIEPVTERLAEETPVRTVSQVPKKPAEPVGFQMVETELVQPDVETPFEPDGVQKVEPVTERPAEKTPEIAVLEVAKKKPSEADGVQEIEPEIGISAEEASVSKVLDTTEKKPVERDGVEQVEPLPERQAEETHVSTDFEVADIKPAETGDLHEVESEIERLPDETAISGVFEVMEKEPVETDGVIKVEQEFEKLSQETPTSAVPEVVEKKPPEPDSAGKVEADIERPADKTSVGAVPGVAERKLAIHEGLQEAEPEIEKPAEKTPMSALQEVTEKTPMEPDDARKVEPKIERHDEETPVSPVPGEADKKPTDRQSPIKAEPEIQRPVEETPGSALPAVQVKQPSELEDLQKDEPEIERPTEETPVSVELAVAERTPAEPEGLQDVEPYIEKPAEKSPTSVVPEFAEKKLTEHDDAQKDKPEIERLAEETAAIAVPGVAEKKPAEPEGVQEIEPKIEKPAQETPVSPVPEMVDKKPTERESAIKMEPEIEGPAEESPVSAVPGFAEKQPAEPEGLQKAEPDFERPAEETPVSFVPEAVEKEPIRPETFRKIEPEFERPAQETPLGVAPAVEERTPAEPEGLQEVELEIEKFAEKSPMSAVPEVAEKKPTEQDYDQKGKPDFERLAEKTAASAMPEVTEKAPTETEGFTKVESKIGRPTEETPMTAVPEVARKKPTEPNEVHEVEPKIERSAEEALPSPVPEPADKKPAERESVVKVEWEIEGPPEESRVSAVPEVAEKESAEPEGVQKVESKIDKRADESPVSPVPEGVDKKPMEPEIEGQAEESPVSAVPEVTEKQPVEPEALLKVKPEIERHADETPVSFVPDTVAKKPSEPESVGKVDRGTERPAEETSVSGLPAVAEGTPAEPDGSQEAEPEIEKLVEKSPTSAVPEVGEEKPTEHDDAQKGKPEFEGLAEETAASAMPEVAEKKPAEPDDVQKLEPKIEKPDDEAPVSPVPKAADKKPAERERVVKVEPEIEEPAEESPVSAVPVVAEKQPAEPEGLHEVEPDFEKIAEETPVSSIPEALEKKPTEPETAEKVEPEVERPAEDTPVSGVPTLAERTPAQPDGLQEVEPEIEKPAEKAPMRVVPEVAEKKPTEHDHAQKGKAEIERLAEETAVSVMPEVAEKKPAEPEGLQEVEPDFEKPAEETPVSSIPEALEKKPTEPETAEKVEPEVERPVEDTPVSGVPAVAERIPAQPEGLQEVEPEIEKPAEKSPTSVVPEVAEKKPTEHDHAQKGKAEIERLAEETAVSVMPEVAEKKPAEPEGVHEIEPKIGKQAEATPVSPVPEVVDKKPTERESAIKVEPEIEGPLEESPVSAVPEVPEKQAAEPRGLQKVEPEIERPADETPVSSVPEAVEKKPTEPETAGKVEPEIERPAEETPVSAVPAIAEITLAEPEGLQEVELVHKKSAEKSPTSAVPEVAEKKPTEHDHAQKDKPEIERLAEETAASAVPGVAEKKPAEPEGVERIEMKIEEPAEEAPVRPVPEVVDKKATEPESAIKVEPEIEGPAEESRGSEVLEVAEKQPAELEGLQKHKPEIGRPAEKTPVSSVPEAVEKKPTEPEAAGKVQPEIERPAEETTVGVVLAVAEKTPTEPEGLQEVEPDIEKPAEKSPTSVVPEVAEKKPTERDHAQKDKPEIARLAEETAASAVPGVAEKKPAEPESVEKIETKIEEPAEETPVSPVPEVVGKKPTEPDEIHEVEPKIERSGPPEEEKSVPASREPATTEQKPASPSAQIEVFEEVTPETSLSQGSGSITRDLSETRDDGSALPDSNISKSSPVDESSVKLSEEKVHHFPLDLDASSATDLSSSPVALKKSAGHPDLRTMSDKEPESATEIASADLEMASEKSDVCDARLSSEPEGTKVRDEASYGEADEKQTATSGSPPLIRQEQDSYEPEAPWIHHRGSQDVPSLEISDQPMKDPRATCPTSLDAPELAHMQQRMSVEYESSITSVSDIEFAIDAKTFRSGVSEGSWQDDSKTAECSKGENDASRPSSPESPPKSPVKRIAAEHPRTSKRARTTSESKHPIATQGSSEADISSEDEDSAHKVIAHSFPDAPSYGAELPKESPQSAHSSQQAGLHPEKDKPLEGDEYCALPGGADYSGSRHPPLEVQPDSLPYFSDKTEGLYFAHKRTPSEEDYLPIAESPDEAKKNGKGSEAPQLASQHVADSSSSTKPSEHDVQVPPSLLEPEKAKISGETGSQLDETYSSQLKRSSIESETTSSSDDAGSGRRSLTGSKDTDLMREYTRHLETSPSARFSVDSTCSVTSEERSYTELEKPYQKDDSRESFSSTVRDHPDQSSVSGTLYSDSTIEPFSTLDHQMSIAPHISTEQVELGSSADALLPVKPERPTQVAKMEQQSDVFPTSTATSEEMESDVEAPLCEETVTREPGGHISSAAEIPMMEARQPVTVVAHGHGIASGLFAALKTELCVIDSPSMDTVLVQTGKDAQSLSDQGVFDTSLKFSQEHRELDSSEIKIPETEREAPTDQARSDNYKIGSALHTSGIMPDKESKETRSISGDDEALPGRKVSGEVTPVKALRFQLGDDSFIEPLADHTDTSAPCTSFDADHGLSKEVFETKVRLEKFLEAEFLETMATDEEEESSRASVKPSTTSITSSSHQENGHKVAEPKDDVTDDGVTLASGLSSGLPTELVCMAQSSVDLSKDITRITKCADSQERVSPPPTSPLDAAKQDEPAAVAAGLASGLPVELVCMVESRELCSEIKRAEEEAIHHVIEKKADYAEEDDGVAMQAYIERRLSDSDHFTDKQQRASPPSEIVSTSQHGMPIPERKPSKGFDELHLNGTSHSPPSVGLVAGLAAGLATELVCMPQSAEELCIDASESRWPPARGSRVEPIPPEMTASIYEELTEHTGEKPCSDTDTESVGQGAADSAVPHRMGQIPVQREVITTVTSRRVVYQHDGLPDTWDASTFSEPPQHDTEDDSRRTTVTYVYRTYTSGEGDDKGDPTLSSGTLPSSRGEDGLPFDILRSTAERHPREEDMPDEGDHVTGTSSRSYVYTVSSDHSAPEAFIRHADDTGTLHHPDSSIHSIAMDEVARITEMAAAAVSQSPNGWTVVHRSADSSSQRPLELTSPAELVERRNGHATHVTETRQIVYHPGSSAEFRFALGPSAEETCLPPEGSDPKTILEFMAAQTKQAAKEMLEEQPLYEEDEEAAQEQSSLSDASPLVEEPVFGKTLQPDYPELVELSAGNTPSEPPSPHSAAQDARVRHNGEPSGTSSVQRMVVVEETEPTSTMAGGSEARRVVSYVEEPTTVVREEWVLESGRGAASHVISQSSMFQHEVLTREESTSAGTASSPASTGGDAVRFTTLHHLERDLGAAAGAVQRSSLKASMAAVQHEQLGSDAEGASGTEAPRDTVRELQTTSAEGQANGRRDGDAAAPFDIRDWGKPLGLPVPPDPSSKSSKTGGKKAGAAAMPRDAADVVYVDLTYVPHHGDPGYCDAEFFSRVRARYYVLSGTNPSQQVLDALLEAKRGWGEPDAPVTVIPTYETDALCYWIAHNQKALEEHHIDVAPSASRCTINLQDHESSCAAYRLEF
ncbi:microtubule-associated protein futsch isoform X4 [Dermacentor albipictus]|uniref:microtubule-associated protein futsch isoform X4 n=1 Tax=Dermacentor albipictus TaxID=60249 RepID=UPI0031FE10B9